MNLLITGAAGFIGSHFAIRHKSHYPDDNLVVLDALTYAGHKEYLDPILDDITFVEGDIANVETVAKLVLEHQIDVIVNFAAETHVDRSIGNAAPFLHSNVIGVASLIEVLKAQKGLRLLHISTDEVYGDLQDDDPAFQIEDRLMPSSPYSASKASAEMLLMAARRTFGIPIAISRCTNNYGPHQAPEKFIPTIIRKALAGERIPVYGTGENKRDWLYAADHCDALEIILHEERIFTSDSHDARSFIFNISADDEQKNIDVARMVLDVLGKSHDLLEFVTDRPGHDWRYAIDSSVIRAMGWKPKTKFEDGLDETIRWFRDRAAELQ